MQFRDRLFAALAKEIEKSMQQTALNSVAVLQPLEFYHQNVGYYHALKNTLAAMEDIVKKEEGEGT